MSTTHTKDKWYVGARRDAPYVVFQSRTVPTESDFGTHFGYCFGPYPSENKAVTVARYQAHGAFPLYGYMRGPGFQLLNSYQP